MTSESLVAPWLRFVFVYSLQSDFIFTLDLAYALLGDRALGSALTAAVRAARKRGASTGMAGGGGKGGGASGSVLISSVTFKLSLEAAAAADHVSRALGCWGRISSAGSGGQGRRPGEGRPRAWGREPGRAGRRARRSQARPWLEPPKDRAGKRSSPQPVVQTEKENLGPHPCAKSSQGVCRDRGKLSVYLVSLVSVGQNVKPTSRSLFLTGKRLSPPVAQRLKKA